MPKSLVRVHTGVRKSGTPEYIQAIQEFTRKMGGAKLVIGAILKSQPNSSGMLFDNSVKVIRRTIIDDEDIMKCL